MKRSTPLLAVALAIFCLSGCVTKPLLDIDIQGLPVYVPADNSHSGDLTNDQSGSSKKSDHDD